MAHDAWFFIGIFVFIFIIWIATGGPLHPISFTGPSLSKPEELGGGTYLSLPRAPYGVGGGRVVLPGSTGGEPLPGGYSRSQETAPSYTGAGTAFGVPSPYRSLVSLNRYVSGAGNPNPGSEYLQIRSPQNAGAPVVVSGWTLWSEATGTSAAVPKGTEIPTSGIVNAAEDIVLAPGDVAILVSGSSPIGASFRENKCIGYFSTFQTFTPQLPQSCPKASDELTRFYGGTYIRDAACIDYVDRIGRCQVTLSPPSGLSGACQAFVVKYLNYNGCVEAHRTDADFRGNTWRIYLGRTGPMWRTTHEIVKLLDTNGKVVDAFSY